MAKTLKPKTERRKTTRKTDEQAADVAMQGPAVSEETIAKLAFEYYCARGGEHGHALEDWLQAERTLTSTAT